MTTFRKTPRKTPFRVVGIGGTLRESSGSLGASRRTLAAEPAEVAA